MKDWRFWKCIVCDTIVSKCLTLTAVRTTECPKCGMNTPQVATVCRPLGPLYVTQASLEVAGNS